MYIIKNALRNIVRTKVRNVLIGIIVVIVAVSSCIALSISNSASELVKTQKDLNSIKATITVDNEKMRESMKEQMNQDSDSSSSDSEDTKPSFSFERPELTVDQIKTYGASKYVDSYSYYLTSSVNSTTIDPYSTSTSSSDDTSSTTTSADKTTSEDKTSTDGKGMGGGMMDSGDFTMIGYSDLASMTDFIDGTSKITDGAMFDADETSNVCVISSEVAILNDLSVGSSITFDNPQDEDETFTMKVVGIYEAESTDTTNAFMQNSNNPSNKIITNYTALNKIVTASEAAAEADTSTDDSSESEEPVRSTALSGQLTSYFVVEDEAALENFKTDLTSMGLSDDFTVTSDLDTVEQTLEPIENLASFAKIFLLIVLIVGGGILVILNMINIRERKYEIGVLTAIGMKKSKVAMQFVCELFAVTLVSIIIGTSIGAVASVPVASKLLESQVSSQTSSTQQVSENFGKGGGGGDMPQGQAGGGRGGSSDSGIPSGMFSKANVKYVDQINAAVNIPVLLELLAIGIFLTLISGSVALIAISRYSPLKILSSRT